MKLKEKKRNSARKSGVLLKEGETPSLIQCFILMLFVCCSGNGHEWILAHILDIEGVLQIPSNTSAIHFS